MVKSFRHSLFMNEPALWLAWLTVLVFIALGNVWPGNLQHTGLLLIIFIYLFVIILWNSFEVAHHVEALAETMPEPYSTVVLTLTVIFIEVSLIASIMLTGPDNPTLARDTMYAVVMIFLNGIVGLSLLLGGLRYQEQQYNLRFYRLFKRDYSAGGGRIGIAQFYPFNQLGYLFDLSGNFSYRDFAGYLRHFFDHSNHQSPHSFCHSVSAPANVYSF